MAIALTDAVIWYHGHDLTADSNQLSLEVDAEDQDVTVFGTKGWRARVAGLKQVTVNVEGFWAAAPDQTAFEGLGVMDWATTIAPIGEAGRPAYLFQAGLFNYSQLGEVGEPAPFSMTLMGSGVDGLVRGVILTPAVTVDTTGPVGPAVQLPTVDAGQHLFTALHVFQGTTTLTVAVESSATPDFAAPTTRALITAPDIGGYWGIRAPGPITDTWYRVTVTAIDGPVTIAASAGVA